MHKKKARNSELKSILKEQDRPILQLLLRDYGLTTIQSEAACRSLEKKRKSSLQTFELKRKYRKIKAELLLKYIIEKSSNQLITATARRKPFTELLLKLIIPTVPIGLSEKLRILQKLAIVVNQGENLDMMTSKSGQNHHLPTQTMRSEKND